MEIDGKIINTINMLGKSKRTPPPLKQNGLGTLSSPEPDKLLNACVEGANLVTQLANVIDLTHNDVI